MYDVSVFLSAARPLVCYPERSSGDQPPGGESGESLHGQQFWHLAIAGQAVHERRSSHQGRRLPGRRRRMKTFKGDILSLYVYL